MILHIGDDWSIPMSDVVAIVDRETARKNDITRQFIEMARQGGKTIEVSGGQPKSYILTHTHKGVVIYSSPISSVTLMKRANTSPGKIAL